MVYFMIQPVGIMLEDFVVHVGRKMGWRESGELRFLFDI